MHLDPTVFIVDDDQDSRSSLKWLIESIGLSVETYSSAEDFLATGPSARPGCMLLDIRMPGMGGLRLLEQLQAEPMPIPVIMVTGHGEVALAVKALKAGAFDFIEKPATHQQVLERVQDALATDRKHRERARETAAVQDLLDRLTLREREVLELLVEGQSTKSIAQSFGISERTIEKHRERLMRKLGSRSLAQLIRLVVEYRRLS